MSATTVAVDAIGGEGGLSVTLPAVLSSLEANSDLSILLVGPEQEIAHRIRDAYDRSRLRLVDAIQYVDMDEAPSAALRFKKKSSMRIAIDLVHAGEADACVSAGNTGALMAISKFVLKTLDGIHRPAICGTLPRAEGQVHMMDLGANIACSASLLFQFGVMASIMVRYLDGIENPSVGLLNIGIEEIKGNETVKEAAELFRSSTLHYKGFVEGDAIFTGDTDIIVCDGFSGNVALKTSEGLAQMLTKITREVFTKNAYAKIAGKVASPALQSIFEHIDHRRYNGAVLLGLQGAVIKSHGSADTIAFAHAIDVARRVVNTNLIGHIGEELSQLNFVAIAN
ncbi:MAG: phosphate acyltransferase [Acidiferrobacteraceae bacterium]|nr:phosphate acyltransferase [Acidiferrobacteraceae bacterium]